MTKVSHKHNNRNQRINKKISKSIRTKWTKGGEYSKENFIKLFVVEFINVIINDRSNASVFHTQNIKKILVFFELLLTKNNSKLNDIFLEVLNWEKISNMVGVEIRSNIENNCLATFAINHMNQNYDYLYRYLKNLNNDMNNDIIYEMIASIVDKLIENNHTSNQFGNGFFSKFGNVIRRNPNGKITKPNVDTSRTNVDTSRTNMETTQSTNFQNSSRQNNTTTVQNIPTQFSENTHTMAQIELKQCVQIITNIITMVLEEIKKITGKDVIDIIWSNHNLKRIFDERRNRICMYIYTSAVLQFYKSDKILPVIVNFITKNDTLIAELCIWIMSNDILFKKLICKILKDELNLYKMTSYVFTNIGATTSIAPIGFKIKSALEKHPEFSKIFEKSKQPQYNPVSCPYKLSNT